MNDTGIRAPHVMTRRFVARNRFIQPRDYLALALLTLGNVGCGDGDAGPSGVNAASASPDTSMSTSSSGNGVSTDATADASQTSGAAATSSDSATGQATDGDPSDDDSAALGGGGGANDGSDNSPSNAGGAGGNPSVEPMSDDESVSGDSDDSSVADDGASEANTDGAGGQTGDDTFDPPGEDGVGGMPGVDDEGGEEDEGAAGAGGTDSGDDMADDSDSGDDSSGSDDGCPGAGNVEYTFNDLGAWPEDAIEKITPALDEALYYYNCYSDLSHTLTINYKPGVQTAEANVDGWISFGTDRNYMVTATVMHEIGHTMGVGFSPWSELMNDGRWIGSHVVQLMADLPVDERDDDETSLRDYITADGQHFWPYGLNYASEHKSEWSLINHVRIVAAMNRDKDEFRGR